MARLTIAQTAAPDFSNAASLLNQSGKALDGAFETASGVLSKYKSGQEEKADGEIIKEIARLNDESEIEKFLASDKVQNSPLSRNMQDKLIGLRGQLLDFAATRANTEGRQSSTNATDSATRLAEAREPLGLRLLGAQVANAEQGNVDQLTRSEYLRDQLQSDLDTAQVGRDNTIVSTQGTQIDNETRGARNNASLGQTLATTGQIKANTELTGLNSDGKRTSNAVDELRLAAEPATIERGARSEEASIDSVLASTLNTEARTAEQIGLNNNQPQRLADADTLRLLNIDGTRTSNDIANISKQSSQLDLNAQPQLISDQARLRELGIEGTVTNNATAEIARQSGQLNLNAQPTLINQEIAQNSANRAATESSTASNNASRVRLNQEASRQQQRFQQEENTRTKLQALGPAYIEAYQAAKQDGSVANINRLTQLMEIAELTPNESNEIFSTIGSVGTIADARNQDNQNREDKRLTDEATLNALIDPTITTSQDAVRQVAGNTNLNATQALAAAQNVATLSSGQLDVVVSPDVGVDEDIASTIRAAESRYEDKTRSNPVTRRFTEAEKYRKELNKGKHMFNVLSEMFPNLPRDKTYDLEVFINENSDSNGIPPEYLLHELAEEYRSYDNTQKIKDLIGGSFLPFVGNPSLKRTAKKAKENFSEQDRASYEEEKINFDRQSRDLVTEQNKLNRIRSSILKYGSGTVPASLIAEERAQFAKTLELADSIAQ